MNANVVHRKPQCSRNLILILRHLDRSPNIHYFTDLIPFCDDTKCLNWYCGRPAPASPITHRVWHISKIFCDRAPFPSFSKQDVTSVIRVNKRLVFVYHFFRVDGRRQGFVLYFDQFSRILRDIARVSNNCRHPLPSIAGHTHRQWMPSHIRQVQPVKQRVGLCGKLITG